MPTASHRPFKFPENAFFLPPAGKEDVLGSVKSKVNFNSLDLEHEDEILCGNYFNKAVNDLLKAAKDKGADAVVDVRSVVYLMDGRMETFSRPECADDGDEGQVLTQGLAIRWEKPAVGAVSKGP